MDFLNPLRILFWNTRGWATESTVSFLNLHREFPGSLFGYLGILLSWCWIGGVIYLAFHRKKENLPISYSVVFFVWVLGTLPANLYWTALWDTRMYIIPLLPFTFLIFFGFHKLLLNVGKRKLVLGALAVLFSLQIFQNVRHSVYILSEYGSKDWVAHHNSKVEVYKQLTGKENPTELDLTRFFSLSGDYPLLRSDTFWPTDRVLGPQNRDYEGYKMLLERYGYFYFASVRQQPESEGVVFVKQLDCLTKSPYSCFIRKFIPRRVGVYYLYRVASLPSGR